MKTMPTIIIEVSEGCVRCAYTSDDCPPIRVVLVDHDCENEPDSLPHCSILPQDDVDVFYNEVGIELETKVFATLGVHKAGAA